MSFSLILVGIPFDPELTARLISVGESLNAAQAQLQRQQFLQQNLSPSLSTKSSEDSSESAPNSKSSRRSTKELINPESVIPEERQCPLCKIILPSQKEFTIHIRGHNNVKPKDSPKEPGAKVYFCCLCGKMLSSFSSLDRHMLVHSGERPFSCTICGQTFTTNGNMHRHTRTHGNRNSRESDSSGSSGSKRGGRKRKASTGPGQRRPSNTNSPSPNLAQPQQPLAAAYDNQVEPDVRRVNCPLCTETFYAGVLVDSHIAACHPGQPVPCKDCPMAFPTYTFLAIHRSLHHPDQDNASLIQARLAEIRRISGVSPPVAAPVAAPVVAAPAIDQVVVPAAQELQPTPPKIQKIEASPIASPTLKKDDKILDLSTQFKVAAPRDTSSPKSVTRTPGPIEDFENVVDEHEEELKGMKLKGEFPCRLCSAVYPNLRALKGHNKEHMTKAPYTCNVGNCTYSSNDKGTLVRHMRTHTGEKPFECTICNFGFTTKANCERHVKNKHGKSTREEVVDSIIIHGESDEGGSERQVNLSFSGSTASSHQEVQDVQMASPKVKKEEKDTTKKPHQLFAPYIPNMFKQADEDKASEKSPNSVRSDDTPLDLSKVETMQSQDVVTPQQMAHFYQVMANNVEAARAVQPGAFGQPLYGLHGRAPLFNPFLLPNWGAANTASTIDTQQRAREFATLLAHQEALRRHQAQDAAKDQAMVLQYLNCMQAMARNPFAVPQTQQNNIPVSVSPASVASVPAETNGDNDYKLVVKDGVIVKKQKQKRYRTERPFQCIYCCGKFTLRPNMDRHIKQQHPGKPLPKREEKSKSKDLPETELDVNIEDMGVNMSELEAYAASVSTKPFETFFEPTKEENDPYKDVPNMSNCPFCGLEAIPFMGDLRDHMIAEHSVDKNFYKCFECPLWYISNDARQRHFFRAHGKKAEMLASFASVAPEAEQASHASTPSYAAQHFKRNDDASSNEGDVDEGKDEEIDVGNSDKENPSPPTGSHEFYFKCHLCDECFGDRDEAIRHLKESHQVEYQALIERDAFNITSPPSTSSKTDSTSPSGQDENDVYDQIRGSFPDYASRKIVCLFCMRKFWSNEDLRRHVRTHTGERPYECMFCHRKFSLKHSMLRHRKTHDSGVSSCGEMSCDDTDSDATTATPVGGRSSPEDTAKPAASTVTKDNQEAAKRNSELKKKRLMDKINKLSSLTASSTAATVTSKVDL